MKAPTPDAGGELMPSRYLSTVTIMARYDCFMFFNELDILEIRLRELFRYVDMFVLVEAPWTFQGAPKPLLFHENRTSFRRFLPQIRHVVVEDLPDSTDPWQREFHQRNCIRRGLQGARPDDLVLVSDADEIIRPRAMAEAERRQHFCFLELDLFYYFLDWRARPWLKAFGGPFAVIQAMADLSEPRMHEARFLETHGLDSETHVIHDAGWHFSWMGGTQRMSDKLHAFAHTEEWIRSLKDPARLRTLIASRKALGEDITLSAVALSSLPDWVRRHARRYHRMGLLEQRPAPLMRRLFSSADD